MIKNNPTFDSPAIFRALDRFADPTGMGQLFEQQRRLQEALGLAGVLSKLDPLQGGVVAAALAAPSVFGDLDKLQKSLSTVQLGANLSWANHIAQLHESAFPPGLAGAVTAFENAAKIGGVYRSHFERDVLGATLPSLQFLAAVDMARPTAVMAMLAPTPADGILALLATRSSPEAEPVPVVSPWSVRADTDAGTEQAERRVNIHITLKVECMFCGRSMLAANSSLTSEVTDGGEFEQVLAVAPCCPECIGRQRQDAGYFLRKLGEVGYRKPKLVLLPGDGSGDGVAKGQLRIVRAPSQEDDPDD